LTVIAAQIQLPTVTKTLNDQIVIIGIKIC